MKGWLLSLFHSLWPLLSFFLLLELNFICLVGKCTSGLMMVEYMAAKSREAERRQHQNQVVLSVNV